MLRALPGTQRWTRHILDARGSLTCGKNEIFPNASLMLPRTWLQDRRLRRSKKEGSLLGDIIWESFMNDMQFKLMVKVFFKLFHLETLLRNTFHASLCSIRIHRHKGNKNLAKQIWNENYARQYFPLLWANTVHYVLIYCKYTILHFFAFNWKSWLESTKFISQANDFLQVDKHGLRGWQSWGYFTRIISPDNSRNSMIQTSLLLLFFR